ncbi:PfkB family carbohydrate kinase [Tropicimonas sp. S265A]|uniref:PfkB family carbohydrate kinase n=1 Tax=Tropicimonas sp. S265A TaxID=3415134 RepID=UPI003C7E1C9F
MAPDILCIGSVLWDIIGKADQPMKAGYDVPGRITRLPGGVAMNVAMTLRRIGLSPGLLTAIGTDPDGDELLDRARALGLITDHIHRIDGPTDRYMAVEGTNGLVAAIADAHTLEAAGDAILAPLADGRLGTAAAPWTGPVALDGNLTDTLLSEIATSPLFARASLSVVPASPGKARRLLPFLKASRATLYVNLIEANLIADKPSQTTQAAAHMLLGMGATRVVITDGANPATDASADHDHTLSPPPVHVRRVTGAGDTFMAAHIAATTRNADPRAALEAAVQAAAAHISS